MNSGAGGSGVPDGGGSEGALSITPPRRRFRPEIFLECRGPVHRPTEALIDWGKVVFNRLFGRKTQTLESFDASISRERLIQGGRIVVIDDEHPLLIDELSRAGFSVDHDQTGDELSKFDNQLYDVAIVDYHGVGRRLGASHGLELLRYIRRVSPRTRLIAYTSRSLTAAESEFFRLSHAVLQKDLGLGDSLLLIEGELRRAFAKEHLFEALVAQLQLKSPHARRDLEHALVDALSKKDEARFRKYLSTGLGVAVEKALEITIGKLFLLVAAA